MADNRDRDNLIMTYFTRGYRYEEIRAVLTHKHEITISIRHLSREIARLNLHRYGHHSPLADVVNFISNEIDRSGQQHGYRFMYKKCLSAGLRVNRDTVMEALRLIDPDGVDLRKRHRLIRRRYYSRGPNQTWHVDGWDKLVPYGIGVSACIDGYSREIVWAVAEKSNKNPKIIAYYYMDAVDRLGACPAKMRVDKGTENKNIITLQEFLTDDNSSVIVGSSKTNQRIECWWGQYRKGNSEYFISLFQNMMAEGDFVGDFIDKNLIRFCFLAVIQVMHHIHLYAVTAGLDKC